MTGVIAAPGQVRVVKGYVGYGTTCEQSQNQVEIKYADTKLIGNGSFGVVYQARLVATNEWVAIKKVLQDRRFKNRELQIMKQLQHQNVVQLIYYFYSKGEKRSEDFMNLVLEYLPETVSRIERYYSKCKQLIPMFFVKIYMYQVFRALAYIHSMGICHRDIKPQNLLLNTETALVKLCDFGSAKYLVRGESNVSYICSRYYRAPELIFGTTNYSTNVDIWSAGCVFGEMLLAKPLFTGDSGVDQLVEIIKLLGTPNTDQIAGMNPNFTSFKLPEVKGQPFHKVFGPRVPSEATDLLSHLLSYVPDQRCSPLQACTHVFFDELRLPNCRLPNGRDLPPLFNFTAQELSIDPSLNHRLIPTHLQNLQSATKETKSIDDDRETLSCKNQQNQSINENKSINADHVIEDGLTHMHFSR